MSAKYPSNNRAQSIAPIKNDFWLWVSKAAMEIIHNRLIEQIAVILANISYCYPTIQSSSLSVLVVLFVFAQQYK